MTETTTGNQELPKVRDFETVVQFAKITPLLGLHIRKGISSSFSFGLAFDEKAMLNPNTTGTVELTPVISSVRMEDNSLRELGFVIYIHLPSKIDGQQQHVCDPNVLGPHWIHYEKCTWIDFWLHIQIKTRLDRLYYRKVESRDTNMVEKILPLSIFIKALDDAKSGKLHEFAKGIRAGLTNHYEISFVMTGFTLSNDYFPTMHEIGESITRIGMINQIQGANELPTKDLENVLDGEKMLKYIEE